MSNFYYETHYHKDPAFPIIFHFDREDPQHNDFPPHCHESVELLYLVEGEAITTSDMVQVPAKSGDIIVFNSNYLHEIRADRSICRYYCLIVGKDFCDHFGIPEVTYQQVICDAQAAQLFDGIIREMMEHKPYYKQAVKAAALELMVHLSRCYSTENSLLSNDQSRRLSMVKESIRYIRQHFTEPLSIDRICREIGFSKFYFCRVFKEITGRTVNDYINFVRCSAAHKLLVSRKCNVGESAFRCGFRNLSHFSKTYRKYIGELPSNTGSEKSEPPINLKVFPDNKNRIK